MSIKGLQFNPPPTLDLQNQITKSVAEYFNQIPLDKKGGLFTVATTEGVNAVVAVRVDDRMEIAGWIGKKWGTPLEYGVAAKILI